MTPSDKRECRPVEQSKHREHKTRRGRSAEATGRPFTASIRRGLTWHHDIQVRVPLVGWDVGGQGFAPLASKAIEGLAPIL
jgi:hypothetical protein